MLGISGYSHLSAYRSNISSSRVFSYGGPPFKVGMNVSEWENNLVNDLVAVNCVGKPLHSVITSQNLQPELSNPTDVFELKKIDVISRYYEFLGRTGPNAPSFDFQANMQSPGSCKEAAINYTFGGVYQTCTSNGNNVCGHIIQKILSLEHLVVPRIMMQYCY